MSTNPQFEAWWAEFSKKLDVFERSLAKEIAWAAWQACGTAVVDELEKHRD